MAGKEAALCHAPHPRPQHAATSTSHCPKISTVPFKRRLSRPSSLRIPWRATPSRLGWSCGGKRASIRPSWPILKPRLERRPTLILPWRRQAWSCWSPRREAWGGLLGNSDAARVIRAGRAAPRDCRVTGRIQPSAGVALRDCGTGVDTHVAGAPWAHGRCAPSWRRGIGARERRVVSPGNHTGSRQTCCSARQPDHSPPTRGGGRLADRVGYGVTGGARACGAAVFAMPAPL